MQSKFVLVIKGLTSDVIQKAGAANNIVKHH
jgi:hypothetical protein